MAKQGMKRPEFEHKKNQLPPVPEVNSLAVENLLEDFDMTAADMQDL